MIRDPHITSEMAVIGGILSSIPGRMERIGDALRRLKFDDFGDADLNKIYVAICALHRDGKAPDMELVLMRCSEIERAMLHSLLFECLEAAGSCNHFSEHVSKVKQESCRRQLDGVLIEAKLELKQANCNPSILAARLADSVRNMAREGQLEAFKPIDGATLIGMPFKKVMWVVEQLLPEGLTVLAGPPKLGKSWLVLLVALAIVNGADAVGKYPCNKGEVLYLALEDTPRRMKERLQKIVNRSQLSPSGLHVQHAAPFIGSGLESYLRTWMDEHPTTKLIIVDTLAKVRPPKKRDQELYAADYAVVSALKAVADEKQVAIVVVTHTRKMADADPLAEVSGTMGITGAADTIMVLKRERGQAHAVLHITGRDVDEQELALTWNADAASWMLAGNAKEVRQSEPRKEIIEVFRREGRPLKMSDLYDNFPDKNRNSLRSLVADMVKDRDLIPVGSGLYILNDSDEPPFACAASEVHVWNQQDQHNQQQNQWQHDNVVQQGQQSVDEELI
jgi:replicative DNA helicase